MQCHFSPTYFGWGQPAVNSQQRRGSLSFSLYFNNSIPWHVSSYLLYNWYFLAVDGSFLRETCLSIGGNQRELARQKNAKKQSEISKKKGSSEKGGNKGMSLEERRHRLTIVQYNFRYETVLVLIIALYSTSISKQNNVFLKSEPSPIVIIYMVIFACSKFILIMLN